MPQELGHGVNVALVGTAPPRRCGIATFTDDLRQAIPEQLGEWAHASAVGLDRRAAAAHLDDLPRLLRPPQRHRRVVANGSSPGTCGRPTTRALSGVSRTSVRRIERGAALAT